VIAYPAHAGAMAAIHAAAFPDDPWESSSFLRLLGQPGVTGFIDPRGAVLLLRVAADEAEILTIGVTAKRRGLGTALMRAAIEKAKSLGAAVLHLEAGAGNAAALGFYASLGFSPVGRRPKYYANGDDAVLLSLRLEAE
jgi:ribosomal-protein-alanine N-acetyltransferase